MVVRGARCLVGWVLCLAGAAAQSAQPQRRGVGGEGAGKLRRDRTTVEIDGSSTEFRRSAGSGNGTLELVSAQSDGPFTAFLRGDIVSVAYGGLALTPTIVARIDIPCLDQELGGSGNTIAAPLHGVVSLLHVALGDRVEKGRPVLQMEAMKLIHTLKAPMDGRIKSILCAIGDTVPAGAILVEIAPEQFEEKR